MFATPPFFVVVLPPAVLTVPEAFDADDWSLTEVTSAPAQFAPSDWSLEDTP